MSNTVAVYASALREVNWSLLALRILVFVNNLIEVTVSGGRKVAKGLIEYNRPNEWLFFDGCSLPVPGWKFQEGGVGTADVVWRFCPDTVTFYRQTGENADHRLNWLSAEVKFSAVKASLYSLDEFIERVRYFGHEAPSPSVLVNAWSIVSGVVLSKTLGLTLSVIDGDGKEVSYPIDSTVPIGASVAAPVAAPTTASSTINEGISIREAIAIRSRSDLQRFFSDCSGANVMLPSTEKVNEIVYRSVDSIGDTSTKTLTAPIVTNRVNSECPPAGFNGTEKTLDELARNEPETLDLEKVD